MQEAITVVPVGLRVEGRDILVVGAGPIGARKAAAYVDRGARVTVVAPEHSAEMDDLAVVERHHREYESGDLDGKWLAVTATGIPAVDGAVFADAEERLIWCNAADDPTNCSVILPAVARSDDVTIAIHTGGRSPASASWLRRRIEALLDDATLAVIRTATAVRDRVRAEGYPTEVPGWAEVLDGDALALARDGRLDELETTLYAAVTRDTP